MQSLSRFLNKIRYLLQETFLGLRRGGWLNWAAVSTLLVLLFLVGIGVELSWGLDATVQSLGGQLEISVYLEPERQGVELQPQVAQLPHVAEVKVITKDQAWRTLLIEMGIQDEAAMETQLGENPLVDALRVKADSTEALGEVAEQIRQLEGVDEVYYGDRIVEQLAQLQDMLRLGSLTITGVLALTAVAVITTTIRLIVMARRREIEVMQLVGATAAWIYLPFILQGCLFGVISAVGAWGLILGSQQLLQELLEQLIVLPFLKVMQADRSQLEFWLLPSMLLGMGVFLGTTSSLIAVRKSAGR
ncbi:cell division protein FtsX [Synechococcus sp. JA-2-3B'a(2-13)]|uniref:cell division protein FtsX n=1 Tax=Synechococcus sp. (strain JA-2-3B'a(2-13)) TaxID=321332 RepID=UPI0000695076|nr:permease-like cell division protein FtsX [Synechococcus sp. JA-2-3B'a(2-13)]ABD02835.1 putative permease [Synechococcus sp. JA-2-3B'a(2-13)]